MYYYCGKSVGGRLIFLCDYDISKFKLSIPKFYAEMLEIWQDLSKLRRVDDEYMNPIIFNNRKICIKGKMIYSSSLREKGICLISDILDKGCLKPLKFFQNLGINKHEDLLLINDIYKIIPRIVKDDAGLAKFQQADILNYDVVINMSGQEVMFRAIKSRTIYDYLVKELQESYTLKINDGQCNLDFSEKEIGELFLALKSSTLIRKHREFQYKLLHKAIYTKEHLMKFGFVTDNLCSFCQQATETYLHLFLDCLKVKQMWQALIQIFNLEEIDNLEWRDIFVGLPGKSTRIKYVNTVIFMVKYIIFQLRAGSVMPSVKKIKKLILDYREEEKKLASKRGKLAVHLQKWEHFDK